MRHPLETAMVRGTKTVEKILFMGLRVNNLLASFSKWRSKYLRKTLFIRVISLIFVSLSIPIVWHKLNFFHISFIKILRVSSDRKLWLHFFQMLKDVRFLRTNPTYPQGLTKDYRMLDVIWMRQCIVDKLVPVYWFNVQICWNFTIWQSNLQV